MSDIDDKQRGITNASRGLARRRKRPPAPCRSRELIVPTKYERFEAMVMRWMARCVQSRTEVRGVPARRERALVQNNPSLIELWGRVSPGQKITIVPTYTWSDERIEKIDFDSPDARPQIPFPPFPRMPNTAAPSARPARPADLTRAAPPSPKSIRVRKPRRTRVTRDPPFPDDARDILDDAKRLLEWLRKQGRLEDADTLDRLIMDGARYLGTVAVIIGAYYLGSRFIRGRLLFQWGWLATGYDFHRRLGRISSTVDALSQTLRDIVNLAKKHKGAGGRDPTGVPWRVLDKLTGPNPDVPGQIDDFACGPACVEMVLKDRGIRVRQDDVASTARRWRKLGIKMKRVSPDALQHVLNDLDTASSRQWVAGEVEIPRRRATKLQLVQALTSTGSWIAFLAPDHFVVVDGMDRAGNVVIRDPWRVPGTSLGTKYKVRWGTFVYWWSGVAVFARPR